MARILNSKKQVVCLIREISILPKGYELLDRLICLKCANYFYVYAPIGTTLAKGSCPNCDANFHLTIVNP